MSGWPEQAAVTAEPRRCLAMLVGCPYLFVGDAGGRGLGVFTARPIAGRTVIVADEDGSLRRRALPLAAALAQGWDRRATCSSSTTTCSCRRAAASTTCSTIPASRRGGWRVTAPGARFLAIRDLAAGEELTYDYSCHLLEPRRADGLRLRDAILPRRDRPVRHAAARAAASLSAAGRGLPGGATRAPELAAARPAERWRRAHALALTRGARVAILAGAISAAKVALFAVGSGSFLAEHPAEELAWVYLGLAAIAAASALVLAPSLERARPVKALAWLLVVDGKPGHRGCRRPGTGGARSSAGLVDPGAPLQHRIGDPALAGCRRVAARAGVAPRDALDLPRHGPGRLPRRRSPSSVCSPSARGRHCSPRP